VAAREDGYERFVYDRVLTHYALRYRFTDSPYDFLNLDRWNHCAIVLSM
jgi:hypothetical protein